MEEWTEKINNQNFLFRSFTIDKPKAKILIVHGYAEHSARYQEMALLLNKSGYSVFSYDRRGEGKSEGARAKVHDFSVQVHDLKEVLGRINQDQVPMYILGHSLGGLISISYLMEYNLEKIAGLILSSPFLMPDEDMSPFLQKIAGVVGRILPFLPVVKLDTSLVTRSEKQRIAYEQDPLIYHGSTNAKTAWVFLKAMKKARQNFSTLTIPMLIMHGSADKLSNPKGSEMLYKNTSSTDKSLKIFEGLYHEMMREPEKQAYFDCILNWLQVRV